METASSLEPSVGNLMMTTAYETAASYIASVAKDSLEGEFHPSVAVIAGSGCSEIGESLEIIARIPYAEIPGFPQCTVDGHPGCLLVASISGIQVLILVGRVHWYEVDWGGELPMKFPIRVLRTLQCETLILLSAVGSIDARIGVGDISIVADHINFHGRDPLTGPNEDSFGPRFVAMDEAYDSRLMDELMETAAKHGESLQKVCYLSIFGPSFETPAEVRLFQQFGANVVGMSVPPEAIVARHCGFRVASLTITANQSASEAAEEAISHEENLRVVKKAAVRVQQILLSWLAPGAASACKV